MGWRLARNVLWNMPADLTPAERLLVTVIAWSVIDDTGVGWVRDDKLRRRTGMTASGIKTALQRLRNRGYELRLPRLDDDGRVIVGRDGRPVYACRGSARTYRIPEAWRPDPPDDEADTPTEQRGCGDTPFSEKGGAVTPPNGEKGGALTPKRGCADTQKGVRWHPPRKKGSKGIIKTLADRWAIDDTDRPTVPPRPMMTTGIRPECDLCERVIDTDRPGITRCADCRARHGDPPGTHRQEVPV